MAGRDNDNLPQCACGESQWILKPSGKVICRYCGRSAPKDDSVKVPKP